MPRLLVIRLSALGDVAMAATVVYSLAGQYPSLHIDVVTTPFFARLFVNRPQNVHLFIADTKGEHRGVRGLWRLLKSLAALRPDYVADFHNVLRSWIADLWLALHGAKVVMVDKTRMARINMRGRKKQQKPFTERYFTVLEKLGFECGPTFTSLYERTPAEPPFEPQKPCAGIAPFARYGNKTYPPELMKQVVEILCRSGVHVYLFGSKGSEAELLNRWADDTEGCESVAGRFGIEQELALISRMDVMLTMDSANHHLASLAGTPAVSMWGSTTPACGFMAYGQSADNAICAGTACQPCSVAGKPECPLRHFDCMKKISPETVARKVLSLCGQNN